MANPWLTLTVSELIKLLQKVKAKSDAPPDHLSLTAPQQARIDTALTKVVTATNDVSLKKSAYDAALTVQKAAVTEAKNALRATRKVVEGNEVALSDRIEAGFPDDGAATAPTPLVAPVSLVAVVKNGVHELRWDSGGNGTGVIYLVEARLAGSQDWQLVTAVTARKFLHQGQKAGVQIAYRVRAKRGDQVSGPSNEAVLYSA